MVRPLVFRVARFAVACTCAATAVLAQTEPLTWGDAQPDDGEQLPAAELAARRSARGVWAIANGRTFAYTGLGDPANRLFMITGPHYQTDGNHRPLGAFGEQWIEVRRDGETDRRRAGRRRWTGLAPAAAARTREEFDGGHALVVEDVAAADEPVLVRRIEFVRGADRSWPDELHLKFSRAPHGPARPLDASGDTLHKTAPRGDGSYHLLARVVPAHGIASTSRLDDGIRVRLGDAPTARLDLVLAMGADPTEARAHLESARTTARIAKLAAAGRARPRALFADSLRATPTSGRIAATLAAVTTAIEAQRSLPSGAVGPMVSFKGVWLRDANGPLRLLLWQGRFDAARRLLRYYHNASWHARATRREFPLDLPIDSKRSVDVAGDGGWNGTPVDRCEVPSFVVLQHLWYYDFTGDAELVSAHWPWLRHNALRQDVERDAEGRPLQRFNGDETYLHGAYYSHFPQKDSWPNHLVRPTAYSLDSMLTFVACHEAMARLAPVVGHPEQVDEHRRLAASMRASIDANFWLADRGAFAPAISPTTGRPHPSPFAPVGLAPLWLGTHDANDPRVVRHLGTLVRELGTTDGRVRSTPSLDDGIGSLPGYWLTNLTAVDAALAWRAFEALFATRSASGTWAEIHDARGAPNHGYGDGRYANRYRPWESGLNVDAMLRFLTGLEPIGGRAVRLRPRRPHDARIERLGPIRVGDASFELHWNADGRTVDCRVRSGGTLVVNRVPLRAGQSLTMPITQPARRLPTPGSRPFTWDGPEPPAPDARTTLVLTTGPRPERTDDTFVVDMGMPFGPDDLARLLFADDGSTPRFGRVEIDPTARLANRETLKPVRFWADAELVAALARFRTAGGVVHEPRPLTSWWVAGPFPNPESRGLALEDRPLREPFDPQATFATTVRGIPAARWWPLESGDGRLDLHPPHEGAPRDGICCFARTIVDSPRAGTAELRLGTDDGARVWCNGELVFESIEHRHLTPGEFRIPLRLRIGRNELVVGVEERHGAFGLHAWLVSD